MKWELRRRCVEKIFLSFAADRNEIEVSDMRDKMRFVDKSGKIYKKYQQQFIDETGVDSRIEKWDSFKGALNSKKMKSIAGEVAAKFYFEKLGYQILERHYIEHIKILKSNVNINTLPNEGAIFEDKQCTTKKGPDNGIDGLFFLKGETIEQHSHIVINEAKFRKKLSLSSNDFGFVEEGTIQQSHSNWNRHRFSWPTCLPGANYDGETVIRTATLLDQNGTLKLYEIRDAGNRNRVVEKFASEAPKEWNIRKEYDKNIKAKIR